MTMLQHILVFVSGQTACDLKGRPLGTDDVAVQAGAALGNLGTVLAAAGSRVGRRDDASPQHRGVCARDRSGGGCAVAQFFSGIKPPASTWVGVQALFHPDFLIEIEAMAVVPDRR
jgi:2-iminobutanoate/2-iminopropanoate deaminase